MGWRGSARHWHNYETASLLLAGLATPLVVSVHTVVSFDFSVGIIPGWHATIFPPYFVAGAIYSGFAMVMTLAIPLRKVFGLEDFITMRHLQNMAKIMLATGLIVAYGYGIEIFMAWYSGNTFEQYMMHNRDPRAVRLDLVRSSSSATSSRRSSSGSKKVRNSVLGALRHLDHREHRHVARALRHHRRRAFTATSCRPRGTCTRRRSGTGPSSSGSLGLFFSLMFLFIRFLPVISIFEMRDDHDGDTVRDAGRRR